MHLEYGEEDLMFAAQNRMQNLMWTVSGDYQLDAKPDLESYTRSRYISMYDAVKQGAFARFFDRDILSSYIIKKVYYGADQRSLTEIVQLCLDAAFYRRASAERPGICELREKAFSDLLDLSFHKMCASLTGRMKIALIRGCLYGDWNCERTVADAVKKIVSLENTEDTMELVRVTDELYNTLIDRSFERKHGDLQHVLQVTADELQEFDWADFLEEEMTQEMLEEYLKKLQSQITTIAEEPDEEKEKTKKGGKKKITVITEEAARKMYSYIELNYGRSYLPESEQKRLNNRLCRGAHADCSLYFTDGILHDPVISNAQYVNAKRHAAKNEVMFRNSRNMLARSIEQLTAELKRSLYRRSEPEQRSAYAGEIVPRTLWKVGRMENPGRLFLKTDRRNASDFVVDILMDASGSQRDRQGQVALQAYIISEALSSNNVPHRIMSFCSFWDYTILQRFREYDDPRTENKRILDYVTSSNNRDGLAIRAAGDGLLARQEEGKILIVLSDGKPNDIIVNRPNSRNPQAYFGDYAVNDTAHEVRRLRGSGVCVLGVFTGKEKDLAAEKKIFGKDFAFIRDIESFSKVTGRYLRRLLEDDSL